MAAATSMYLRITLGLLSLSTLGPAVFAQQPETQPAQPTAAVTTADPGRLDDFVTLIAGPNLPPAARRAGARELLRQGWPQTPGRLTTLLVGDDVAAKVAVALALADLPEFLQDAYIEPLLGMLADQNDDARQAAALALAGYRDHGVVPRLREMMLDGAKPVPLRLAAIEALGTMSKRPAAAALVEAIDDPNVAISVPALAALERTTAMSFGGDSARARAWWEQHRETPLSDWQQAQIDRLVLQTRGLDQRLRAFEQRLVASFRADYIRTVEGERGALLLSYLKDDSALVRLLGLELVQRHLGEGKALPAETSAQTRDRVRELLTDADPTVRVAAVQTAVRFRDVADAQRFVDLLATERNVDARRALINGLGYVGDASVSPPLLAVLQKSGGPCLTEAVAALGRLAERGVVNADARGGIAEQLLATFQATTAGDTVPRERVLWAMSQVADPRFGDVFVTALADTEAPIVRQTAARGIAALKHPQSADALIPLTRDADLVVRKTAVEALAEAAATDEHLAALWERLASTTEPDESIRQTAWRAILRILSQRSVAEVEQWLARLPGDAGERDRRTRELLSTMETSLAKVPDALAELGRIWLRIASQRATAGEADLAIAAYGAALRDLRATHAAEVPAAALELLRFALANARYAEPVAAMLSNGNPPLDGNALWQGVKPEIEQRLTTERIDEALTMLEALKARPPAPFTPPVIQEIDALLARALAIKTPPPPTSAPSQPAPKEKR